MIERSVSRFLMVACSAFLFASFMFSSLLLPAKAAANVTIVSHMGYKDFGNYYHVVGEVQNIGDVPVKNVYVSITLYDVHDVVVDSVDTEILLEVLLVGRKAPFMYTTSEENSAKISYYTVSIGSFESSSEKPLGLEILSHSSIVTGVVIRVMTVTGQIKNGGASLAIAVKVVATFYNGPHGTGNVVGVSFIASIPVSLNPNEVGTFTIPQDVTNRETSFVSYVLTAESLEYSGNVVPESPASIMSIIFMATTLVAVAMTRKKKMGKREFLSLR